MLTKADEGGRGGKLNADHCWRRGEGGSAKCWPLLTEGGGGGQEPLFLADVICERPLNRDNTKVCYKMAYVGGPSFHRRPWPFGERRLRACATSATLQPNSSHVNGFLLFMQFPKFLLHIQNSRLQLWLKKSVWIFHMFRIIVQPWSHFPKGAIFEGCARVCSSLEKTLEPESSGEMSESEYIALKSKSSSMKVKVKVNT